MRQVIGNPCWGVVQQMSHRRQSEPHICLSSGMAPNGSKFIASPRCCLASVWGATSDLHDPSSEFLGFVLPFQHQWSCIAPIFWIPLVSLVPLLFWLCELLCWWMLWGRKMEMSYSETTVWILGFWDSVILGLILGFCDLHGSILTR